MSENQIQTFKYLRQTRAVNFQFIACAICILLYVIDDIFATDLTTRFVGVGLFLFSSVTIFIGYLSIFQKDIILFSPELKRLRRIEKEKGIDAAIRLYQNYAKRYRQVSLGIMEILPGSILFIISIGMIFG